MMEALVRRQRGLEKWVCKEGGRKDAGRWKGKERAKKEEKVKYKTHQEGIFLKYWQVGILVVAEIVFCQKSIINLAGR